MDHSHSPIGAAAGEAAKTGFVVVIPAYGEAATIGGIVAGCRNCLAVIVVDDGSADATAAAAAAAGALVVRNERNLGKGASLVRGFQKAMHMAPGAAWVVTLDGDGQHRPADIPFLIACAAEDRIVIGSRRVGGRLGAETPRARYVANRVADFWVSWASGHPVDDSQSGFRVYPMGVLRALRAGQGLARGFGFESEMLIAAGALGVRTVAVPIASIYGGALRRASHFRPIVDIGKIVVMLGGRLLRRGMYPAGLWRVVKSFRR